MIYEKKTRSRGYVSAIIGMGAIVVFLCLFCYTHQSPDVGGFWQMKFVDVVNVFAQLATAAAFFLGVTQYVKQSDKDRNSVFCSECNSIIEQMVAEVKRISSAQSTVSTVNAFIDRMGHLGSDLDVLFQEIPEDASKAIVRMRWQSMYYGYFRPAMNDLDLEIYAISLGAEPEIVSALISDEIHECEKYNVASFLKEYTICRSILSTIVNSGVFDLQSALSDTTSFSHHFMSNKKLHQYMHGTLNVILSESSAPLICAAMSVSGRVTYEG